MKKLYVITGPTACGKTPVAAALAKKINGEVISADSMLVYRGMDIGTAKPSKNEQREVPHHLIDIINPDEPFSAALYQRHAKAAAEDIHRRGKIPILAGGTGFYINALVYGNNFQGLDDIANRERLMKLDATELHGLLTEVDEDSASKIHPNNIKRVARALSFFQTTGQRLSEHNLSQKQNEPVYDTEYIVLYSDRSILYERINKRVGEMLENGLEKEVRGLLKKYDKNLTAMQGIGYKEMVRYINGEISLPEAVNDIKQATRNYAKRQLTWFRHQAKGNRWVCVDGKPVEDIINEVIRHGTEPSGCAVKRSP